MWKIRSHSPCLAAPYIHLLFLYTSLFLCGSALGFCRLSTTMTSISFLSSCTTRELEPSHLLCIYLGRGIWKPREHCSMPVLFFGEEFRTRLNLKNYYNNSTGSFQSVPTFSFVYILYIYLNCKSYCLCIVGLNASMKLHAVLRVVRDRFCNVTLDCRIVRQYRISHHKKGTYKRQNKLSPQNNLLSHE